MTQKNRTLEGKNRTLGGEEGSKIVENRRTSFMYVPLADLRSKYGPFTITGFLCTTMYPETEKMKEVTLHSKRSYF